ncbi:MAG: YerC/YecD family TrpR-related protein [Erysipelotrichaceae bacterium]|nr:YerC/YecD family TrpR-related protein [Erysipelotrichaceae bacterium]
MDDKYFRLYEAFLTCESLDDIRIFLEDVCTYKEIEAMADRLLVARLLLAGHTYEHIEKMTSISSATISRVNRCLIKGNGGYRNVLEKTGEK